MAIYKVTAKQMYYVEADTPEEAEIYFICSDEEHVQCGSTEVIDVEEVMEE